MNKKQDDGTQIPLWLVVIGYVVSVPAGIVLTLLKIFTSNKDEKDEKNSVGAEPVQQSAKQKKQHEHEVPAAARKTVHRSRICVPSLVLNILAGCFLLCAIMNAADHDSLQTFLQYGLSDSLVLLILAAGTFVPARILQCHHDRQNVIRSIIGKRESIGLAQLSSASDLSMRTLRKELQAMINRGEFGEEAYIDISAGRFMRKPDLMEEAAQRDAEPMTEEETGDEAAKFRSIILQIRKRNDEIKDYAVSERIYRIEEHTQNIFDYVTAHPEAMPQIRTFMSYYLPTTLKLLDSYSRIEQVGVAGENMKKSKENIERILDMLVVGFEQQVDQLFRNESMDISTEIKVLEAMMKQDGLDGKSDFDPGYSDTITDSGTAAKSQ